MGLDATFQRNAFSREKRIEHKNYHVEEEHVRNLGKGKKVKKQTKQARVGSWKTQGTWLSRRTYSRVVNHAGQ